jgi:DNA-binding NarL/FixJ family response regulator
MKPLQKSVQNGVFMMSRNDLYHSSVAGHVAASDGDFCRSNQATTHSHKSSAADSNDQGRFEPSASDFAKVNDRFGQPWPDFLVGQAGRPVRVLLIDDDAHMRRVISQELLSDLRCDVVAQGGSVKEGRKLMAQHVFDVMLVDLNLGDGTGFELIEHLKTLHPLAEAVVISCMEDEQHALRAFELGATGYLVKNSWFGNFPQAVLQVVNGGASITPNLARRLLHKLEQPLEPHACAASSGGKTLKEKLSEREKDVLKMVAGYPVKIGHRLRSTRRSTIKNMYRKLQVRSRAQAVSTASHLGLL